MAILVVIVDPLAISIGHRYLNRNYIKARLLLRRDQGT